MKIFIITALLSLIGDGVALWLALHSRKLEQQNAHKLRIIFNHITSLEGAVDEQLHRSDEREKTHE
jgi:hypothetical protein